MNYRQLGDSGISVSEIGFGAWGIGGATPGPTSYGKTDDATSLNALAKALDKGINFFDTSNVYGYGHSERLIGRAFAKCRNSVVIATKAGFVDYERPPDYSAAAIRKSVESSLERLQTDYVDLLQLHNAPAEWLGAHPETLEELLRLQEAGKVRQLGISVKAPADALQLLNLFSFSSVQANFNVLDIRALECGLFKKLDQCGSAFIARTPLCFGFLAGNLTGEEIFDPEDHRSRWSRAQIRLWAESAKEIYAACEESGGAPPFELALRFCLSYPQVTTTIPGMLDEIVVLANARASANGPLSPKSRQLIESMHRTRQFVTGAL